MDITHIKSDNPHQILGCVLNKSQIQTQFFEIPEYYRDS
jgi:hypothetical protein